MDKKADLKNKVKELENKILCYKTVLNNIYSGVIIIDEKGVIFEYNKMASNFEKISEKEALGKNPTDLYFTPGSRLLKVMVTKNSIIHDYTKYLTFNGYKTRIVQSYHPVIDSDNRVVGACSILSEVDILENIISEINRIKNDVISQTERPRNMSFMNIIGNDKEMKQAIEESISASKSDVDVLLIGETGTGKEMFVKAIHDDSSRKDDPFVPINCATIPENLLESILFGTMKGAFTDSKNTTGLFEFAKRGTIFLDELNSMSLSCQAKLLRAIQEKKIRKVGAEKEIPIYCRIIGAINEDPKACIKSGTLRQDLFYRLSAICIFIPPLRNRKDDIALLIDYFISFYNEKYEKNVKGVSDDLNDMFYKYNWVGNVRELQNIIESIFIIGGNERILTISHLPRYYYEQFKKLSSMAIIDKNEEETLSDILYNVEKDLIINALKKFDGNKRTAAKSLGISPQNMNYKIKKFDIQKVKLL